jgi:adenine-specific DNA-methyltransferase
MIDVLPPPNCKIYTPPALAEAMIGQLNDNPSAEWLEPSVGRGAFIQALARKGVPAQRITAIDLEVRPSPADDCASVLRGVDFLRWASTESQRFDRIVANPPYVGMPKLAATLKSSAVASLSRLPATPGLATNYWACFLAASLGLLRRNGSLSFVLPAAWDYADYAAPLREAVLNSFSSVIVHRCQRPLFADVQEGAVVLVAKGYGSRCAGPLRFDYADCTALVAALNLNGNGVKHATSQPDTIVVGSSETILGDLFDVKLGGVTGDSDYFLLTDARRRELHLPARVCTPVVSKAGQLEASTITLANWNALKEDGHRIWLFSPRRDDLRLKSVSRYLRLSPHKGGCNRAGFKISNRDPWYTVPLPPRVDGFLSGMAKHGPWISWRSMRGLTATNTLYVVTCKERLSAAERYAWSIAFLTKQARSSAKVLGRRYADGLVKYEPGDLKRVPLPKPLSTRNAEENYSRIVQILVSGDHRKAEIEATRLCVSG